MTATTVATTTVPEKAEAPAQQRQSFPVSPSDETFVRKNHITPAWVVASPDPTISLPPAGAEPQKADAAKIARKLSAMQVHLLRSITDACAGGDRWLTDDPRFAMVSGLGLSLGALRRCSLITVSGTGYQVTPLGRLVATTAPSLDDLLLKNKRYTQIMRNAAKPFLADDDGVYDVLGLTGDMRGHSLMGQMVAFGMFERCASNLLMQVGSCVKSFNRCRLTDEGRRFITDVLGIALPDTDPGPVIIEPLPREENTQPMEPVVGVPWPDEDDPAWQAGEDNESSNATPQSDPDDANPAHWLVDTAAGQFGLIYEVWQGDYYRNGRIRVEFTDDCTWRINVSFHDGYRTQRREVLGLDNGKRLVARSFSYEELHDTLIQQRLGVA